MRIGSLLWQPHETLRPCLGFPFLLGHCPPLSRGRTVNHVTQVVIEPIPGRQLPKLAAFQGCHNMTGYPACVHNFVRFIECDGVGGSRVPGTMSV